MQDKHQFTTQVGMRGPELNGNETLYKKKGDSQSKLSEKGKVDQKTIAMESQWGETSSSNTKKTKKEMPNSDVGKAH